MIWRILHQNQYAHRCHSRTFIERFSIMCGLCTLLLCACQTEPDPTIQQALHTTVDTMSVNHTTTLGSMNPKVLQPTADVKVLQLTVADKIRQRKPIGVATEFVNSVGVLWSFVQLEISDPTELSLRWWYQDVLKAEFKLLYSQTSTIPKWNSLFIQPNDIGAWHIDLYDSSQDKVLSRYDFKIVQQLNQSSPPLSTSITIPKSVQVRPKTNTKANLINTKTTLHKGLQSKDVSTAISSTTSHADANNHSAETQSNLTIDKLIIAHSIRARRPIKPAKVFNTDAGRIWGYVEVNNPHQSDWVWMEWWHKDQRKSRLRIRIGQSKRWRTWSWQRLHPWDAGLWEVRVLNTHHKVIKRTHFTVNHQKSY